VSVTRKWILSLFFRIDQHSFPLRKHRNPSRYQKNLRRTIIACGNFKFGPLKIESDLADEKVLFLSDIFPTGYMAAEKRSEDVSVLTALKDLAGGIGPDSCIDAVGLESQ
jgi:hypothetical protein